jgi:hypothetical protein
VEPMDVCRRLGAATLAEVATVPIDHQPALPRRSYRGNLSSACPRGMFRRNTQQRGGCPPMTISYVTVRRPVNRDSSIEMSFV